MCKKSTQIHGKSTEIHDEAPTTSSHMLGGGADGGRGMWSVELTLISLSISREKGKPSGHEVNISICSIASYVFNSLCFVVFFCFWICLCLSFLSCLFPQTLWFFVCVCLFLSCVCLNLWICLFSPNTVVSFLSWCHVCMGHRTNIRYELSIYFINHIMIAIIKKTSSSWLINEKNK